MKSLRPEQIVSDLNALMRDSQGFTVDFYLQGGHLFQNVALVPNHSDKDNAFNKWDGILHGVQKLDEKIERKVRIGLLSIVAYVVEES